MLLVFIILQKCFLSEQLVIVCVVRTEPAKFYLDGREWSEGSDCVDTSYFADEHSYAHSGVVIAKCERRFNRRRRQCLPGKNESLCEGTVNK